VTDLELLSELFFKRRIEFDIGNSIGSSVRKDIPTARTEVILEASSNNVVGYTGFVACLYFDQEGTLVGAGAWE